MPFTSIMQLLHAVFSARGNIVRIDSCTDDSIRISLTVAIRLIGAPANRYTPEFNPINVRGDLLPGDRVLLTALRFFHSSKYI